jgi:hypothetical protein
VLGVAYLSMFGKVDIAHGFWKNSIDQRSCNTMRIKCLEHLDTDLTDDTDFTEIKEYFGTTMMVVK